MCPGESIYGGRVDNEFDHAVLKAGSLGEPSFEAVQSMDSSNTHCGEYSFF